MSSLPETTLLLARPARRKQLLINPTADKFYFCKLVSDSLVTASLLRLDVVVVVVVQICVCFIAIHLFNGSDLRDASDT